MKQRTTPNRFIAPTNDVGVVEPDVQLSLDQFEPVQRELLDYELRHWRETTSNSIAEDERAAPADQPGRVSRTDADRHGDLNIVSVALARLAEIDAEEPPVLVGPAWFAQEIVRGCLSAYVEELHHILDNWRSDQAESRVSLQQALYGARLWTRSLLAAYEPPLP